MTSIAVDRLDGLSSATAVKGPCRVVAVSDIVLSGLQTIDGVTLNEGDRVLVAGQTDARANGIYIATSGTWARAKDFSRNRDVQQGTQVFVAAGTLYAASGWYVATANPVVIGTSNITFTQNVLVNAAQLAALEEAAEASADAAAVSADDAEEQADIAEAAALVASGAMTTLLDPQFATKATAEAFSPVSAPDYIRTAGYTTAGDGGGALYKKVGSEPSHSGKFSITLDDGVTVQWFEIVVENGGLNALALGAAGDDNTVNTTPLQAALDIVGLRGGGYVFVPAGTYRTAPLIIKYPNTLLYGEKGATVLKSNADFETLHHPTVWVPKSGCAVRDISFTYVDWDSTDMTSLLTTRPDGNSYYGCHVAVGYTELYNGESSGVYNTFRGVTLQVVEDVEISGISIVGTSVHGIALFNTIGARVVNNSVREFKGTGIYGFICGDVLVSGNRCESSRDDGIYFGGTGGHLGGVWTPLTADDMQGIRIIGNQGLKLGAKAFCASGYKGVVIADNYINETRAAAIWTADEPSQGIGASTDVAISNNVCLNVFGGFGDPEDGYGYSNDLITQAGGGVYYGITINLVDGFTVTGNTVTRSSKVSNSGYRGFFGEKHIYNGVASANRFKDFPRNNLGNENAATPVSENILFMGNVVNATVTTAARLIATARSGKSTLMLGNMLRSLAGFDASFAAIWASISSQSYAIANSFDLSGGLGKYGTADGPSLFVGRDDFQPYDDTGQATMNPGGRIRWSTAVPSAGTWLRRDIIFRSDPSPSGAMGWMCVTSGTFGTLSSVTGDITSASTSLTVNDASSLRVGQYITIAGVTGTKQIRGISGTTVTIDSAADATVTGAAVAWSAPVFKAMASLAA